MYREAGIFLSQRSALLYQIIRSFCLANFVWEHEFIIYWSISKNGLFHMLQTFAESGRLPLQIFIIQVMLIELKVALNIVTNELSY